MACGRESRCEQARTVIDGLPADVVTLALARDIDRIAEKAQLLPTDWQKRMPHGSTPFTSRRGARPCASPATARKFLNGLYGNVPVLDTGARASLTTFVQRRIGDVCISGANEAFLAIDKLGADRFEMVTPSVSILTEPPVAVVDKAVQRRGTERVARAYLEYLYSSDGQEIGARHPFRPRDPAVASFMRGSGSTRAADSSATSRMTKRTTTCDRRQG